MRENRTYGLTRGRSGEAASLYSTAALVSFVLKNCVALCFSGGFVPVDAEQERVVTWGRDLYCPEWGF